MWWRGRKPLRRFAVLLHARHLVITDDRDAEGIGGAYTWCDVAAEDEDAAVRDAIHELTTAEVFVQEVRNLGDASLKIEAEEVIPLGRSDPNRSTGVVFYVARDDD